jgi:hypothetical protein
MDGYGSCNSFDGEKNLGGSSLRHAGQMRHDCHVRWQERFSGREQEGA